MPDQTTDMQVGRIDLGPTEPRHLTQTEQRVMDAALRSSLKIVPDPEVAKLRTLLNGWLYSGAMTGDQLDQLRSDTEKAVQNV